ncbi:MAG: glycoside hydrolase family 92 protein, partial [Flavobacteriales bacterium]|nr:glycoside hydrolase family 92 protein [Flavobacteriales bacterium]
DRALKATGHGGLEQRLDDLFDAHPKTTGRTQSDITGLIGQYAHGNEPSHAMAWTYGRVGRQDKAKRMVDRILTEFYHDAPDGLIGNEDCGQMSAWYVMSALGIYQIAPGDPVFELHAPLFHAYRIHLPSGKEVNVRCTGDLVGDRFIRSTTLNGTNGRLASIPYSTLMNGMDLLVDLTAMWRPLEGARFTTVARDPITSYPPTAPIITAGSKVFKGSMEVTVSSLDSRLPIHCTVNGDRPTTASPLYTSPYRLDTTATVRCIAVDQDVLSPVSSAQFTQIDPDRSITVESKWSSQYAAAGEEALIDGIRGTEDWRTGGWQGYLGNDVLATVDLGSVKQLKRLGLSVIQDQRSWIWYPESVQFAWSTNGRNWSSATVENTVPRTEEGTLTMDMMTEVLNKHARYIKLIAKNPGPCPEWHPGNGDPSFIFTDELLIETE